MTKQIATKTQHQAEQPDHAGPIRLITEDRLELGKVDLRLNPGCGLKAMLKSVLPGWVRIPANVNTDSGSS